MKNPIESPFVALVLLAMLILNLQSSTVFAQGTTAFTYQGQLSNNGTNVNGPCTMVFNLYDSLSGGNLIGGPITTTASIANGFFTVTLDFGSGAFNGSARYLDIAITNAGVTQELAPRIQVLAAPYALYAMTPAGPQGPQGPAGTTGASGPQGPEGPAGATGASGPQGPQGVAGTAGTVGPQGPQGTEGPTGPQGAQGPEGPQGPAGNGTNGAAGPQGPQGVQGPTGPQGSQGPAGAQGSAGAQGPTGPLGPQGVTGATGATGPQGIQGPPGETATNVAVLDADQTFTGQNTFGGNVTFNHDIFMGNWDIGIFGNGGLVFYYGGSGQMLINPFGVYIAGELAMNNYIEMNENNIEDAYEIEAVTFNQTSDRDLKEKFSPVDSQEILERVAGLPISSWNFKTGARTRHIGPMAQDFYSAFEVGADNKHIATVDEGGVALAAIQGLNQKLEADAKAKDKKIDELEGQLAELKKQVQALAASQTGGAK